MSTTLHERIEGLRPLVEAHSGEIEASRRIADEVVAGVRATGLNRALVPRDLGGDEVPLVDGLEAIERLATLDASVAWCAAVGSGTNLFAGRLAPDVAREVFADPDQGNLSVFGPFGNARSGPDGHVLTGRWAFASNSLHSQWAAVGAFFWEGDEPDPGQRIVFVPIGSVVVEDTWHALGLRGTGSHHVTITDAAVDRAHSVAFAEPPVADGPLWRVPMFNVLMPWLGIVPMGVARGALDRLAVRIRDGVGAVRGSLVDDPVGMADYAAASARLGAARAHVMDACARAWDLAERGHPVPKALQAEVLLATIHGVEVAVEVTSTVHRLAGGTAAFADSPFATALRDVETARQHHMFGFHHRPVLGRALAGLDVVAPPYLL
jgi:indole-3-acetate monooxygenase